MQTFAHQKPNIVKRLEVSENRIATTPKKKRRKQNRRCMLLSHLNGTSVMEKQTSHSLEGMAHIIKRPKK